MQYAIFIADEKKITKNTKKPPKTEKEYEDNDSNGANIYEDNNGTYDDSNGDIDYDRNQKYHQFSQDSRAISTSSISILSKTPV